MTSVGKFAVLIRTNGTHVIMPMPTEEKLAATIGAQFIEPVPVMPFTFKQRPQAVKDDYALLVDEDALQRSNFKSNWIASLLADPFQPNKVVGDVLLCRLGEDDITGLTRSECEYFMKRHPIFGEWEYADGHIQCL